MMVVDERHHSHLFSFRPLALFMNESIPDQVTNRFTPRGVPLGGVALVEGREQGALERNADAGQIGHGAFLCAGEGASRETWFALTYCHRIMGNCQRDSTRLLA